MTTNKEAQTATSANARNVRRWVRQRQVVANGRVEPSTVYCVLLASGMLVALIGEPVSTAVWPSDAPTGNGLPALVAAGVGLALCAYFGVLRRLGPLVVSRSAATWLLPAPVSRRPLLLSSLALTVVSAVLAGGLTGLAVIGRVVPRPVPSTLVLAAIGAGAGTALLVMLAAVHSERRPAMGRRYDVVAGLLGGGFVLLAVGARTTGDLRLPLGSLPDDPVSVGLGGLPLLAGTWGTWRIWRGLDTWPTHQIVNASAETAGYADAVYAVEPSFLAEQSTRRFWQRRGGFRATGLFRAGHIPALVVTDLLLMRRKAVRVPGLLGLAMAPAVLADAPIWLVVMSVLISALAAASLTTESIHRDASNPALLRLMRLSGREVLKQRLIAPSVVAGGWCCLALAALQAAAGLAGAWWLLGLAAGPAVGVAAVQRARVSAESIGNVMIETPLGAFPSGMLLWLLNGTGTLALATAPMALALVFSRDSGALDWGLVSGQVVASALGCAALLGRAKRDAASL